MKLYCTHCRTTTDHTIGSCPEIVPRKPILKPGTRLPQTEKTTQDRALTPEHIPSRPTGCPNCNALRYKIKQLETEIVTLRNALVTGGKKPAMTAAERVKRHRAKKSVDKSTT